MTISLKLHHKVGGRHNLIGARTFERERITIGRGAECDVALDDPKKHISRVHAEFAERDGGYWLTVVSKVNPVLVNGERQGAGSRVSLRPGDRFEMGEYEIEVLAPEEATSTRSPLLDVLHASSMTPERAGEIRTEQTVPPVSEPEPPAEITLPPRPAAAAASAPVEVDFLLEAEEPAAAPTPPAPAHDGSVDIMLEPEVPAPPQAPAPAADAFGEATFVGRGGGPEAGNVFEEPTFIGRPLDETPPVQEGRIFEEPTFVARPLAEAPAAPERVFEEPTYVGAPQPPAAPGPARGPVDPGAQQALKAFLEGAKLAPRAFASAEEMDQFMRQCGAIVRAAVEGVMALLVARAAAKKEFRAEDRTMVASRDNNPLKLMEDPQEAIEFLFETRERGGGFLGPVQAVGDAFEDMRAHELALIAGMRAAILGALRRFDPGTLEPELEKAAGGLGLNRKAKLWEQFVLYQQQLAREAEDDFNKVFGREFMNTYMAQVRQIRGK